MKQFQLETREYYFLAPSDDPSGYYKTPVMGWAMDSFDQLMPIVEDGQIEVMNHTDRTAIMLPSGIVHAANGAAFDTLEEWVKTIV